MKLAICHPVVIPARGGCETYIVDLVRRLDQDGHAVHLFASEWEADALPSTIVYHRVDMPTGTRFSRPWRFSQALARTLSGTDHDLSIGFDKVAGVDVQYPLAGLSIATRHHGAGRFRQAWKRGVAGLMRWLDPVYWSFCQFERHQYLEDPRPFIIANSDFVRLHFRRYLGISPSGVSVLHCAIDPDRFAATDRPARRVATRQGWNVEPTDTVALFVAMNYGLKGLEPLIHAVARMPRRERFRLAIVGNPKIGPFVRLAKRLGIAENVRFLGFSADPRNAYFAADLLVHPTFYDPCSLVVQEAQACGLPVITSRFNGAAELLDPPTDGLVIRDPHDRDELAGALSYFLDPVRRQNCARAAMRGGQKWTFEDHYRQLLRLFAEAVRRKRAA